MHPYTNVLIAGTKYYMFHTYSKTILARSSKPEFSRSQNVSG